MPRNSFIITFRLEAPEDQSLISVEQWADTVVDANAPGFGELNKNLFVESVSQHYYRDHYYVSECTLFGGGIEVAQFTSDNLAQEACLLFNKAERDKWEQEGYKA